MFKSTTHKISIIGVFLVAGFFIAYQIQNKEDQEAEKKTSFYLTDIHENVDDDLKAGYLFSINNITYKPGTYHYELHTKANDERVIFLSGNNLFNSNNAIDFSWRQTIPPYRIIKKPKADTLYIIKNGRTIAFPKYLVHNE
ncbi:hypothetical protein [Chryseobacterium sp. Mn2064]|uniref:hypothetical protein n=1 Tax=Chryseobacterium sp. Mn2064 TaxID=3395263 RepID=UPI003BE0844A